ncbi:ROK family transcriptional regulator [Caldalkalibacillus salinus]|uniref:ROK family transcriptional regulator n=1 Tax=Caldalkalibacillus salinus TaxID=2803787 RepID=UPI0019248F1B|nr:ROK family transcriptional regulator [Caldalkalibacillus salinus]
MRWNQQTVKRNNKAHIFHVIKEQAPLSRADIAQRLGYNKATVSSLVSELIDAELVYETGPGESSGGRRPVLLLFNDQAGYAIGIDIGVNYVLGVLTNLQGKVVSEVHQWLKTTAFPDVVDQVKGIIATLKNRIPSCPYGVIGIGIGVPGIVSNDGSVLYAPNLKWRDTQLNQALENEFHLPVIVENEANAGAYGEKRAGAGQSYDHLMYVSAGMGIGVGLILDNQLYKGHKGFSGEAGHMAIDLNGKLCSCGRKGCWEAYASEQALLESARLRGQQSEDITLEHLLSLANQKDADSISVFENVGYYLGCGIANLINTFNPKQVIVGNRLAFARDWIEEPIKHAIQKQALPFHQEGLTMTFSTLSMHSTAIGMSAFATEHFFKEQDLLENNGFH